MTMLKIDPRNRPLRGIRAIAEYLGQDHQLTRRQLVRGMIDADRDGKLFVTTPVRVDNSPLIVGRASSASAA
jgi:hypothetical protein